MRPGHSTSCWIGIIFLVWIPTASAEEFLPATHQKVRISRQVFDQLIRSINDPRTPPEFRMVKGKAAAFDVAQFLPSRHTVYLEEEFYDAVQSALPKEQRNALALILGHELAHFYRNHRWAQGFSRAFAQRQSPPDSGRAERAPPGEVLSDRRKLEAEADYFGGFYSYLAGFQTLSIAPQVFDAIYSHYRLDPALPAYEHLRHRKDTAKEAQQRLRELLPLFETGVHALLIREYTTAGRIFDRIATEFPSPEILNNAGVADALAALEWYPEAQDRYVYPIEIDSESRLAGGGEQRGTATSNEEEQIERRHNLLEGARRHLEKAVAMNPSYGTAVLNLACVLDLLGDYESAQAKAAMAQSLGQSQQASMTLARTHTIAGIISAHQGQNEPARREFERAASLGDQAGAQNLVRLSGAHIETSSQSGGFRTAALPDQISGVAILDVGENDFLNGKDTRALGRWDPVDETWPGVTILSWQKGALRATAIIKGSGPTRSIAFILSGQRGAEGQTVKGVRRGQTVGAIQRAYGAPTSIFASGRGTYHVYHGPYRDEHVGIIFQFNDAQTLEEWVVFRTEQ